MRLAGEGWGIYNNSALSVNKDAIAGANPFVSEFIDGQ
jgi:hypothetical protein